VVLIDEIDKAQRDFPNDILNEIEGMYFKIPELDNVKIEADKAMRPVLVLTSNSEKHLPAAFLRRCVYYHIPFPDNNRLTAIIERRFGKPAFLAQALDIFNQLRNSGLQKKPATAELLDWLQVLTKLYPEQKISLTQNKQALKNTLSVLVKTQEDREIAYQLIDKL
jgi:MoxR-like ATPase